MTVLRSAILTAFGVAVLAGVVPVAFAAGIDTSTSANLPFSIQSNTVMNLTANGLGIGIGSSTPMAPLEVNGSIMIGTSSVCDNNRIGNTRYNSTTQSLEVCNGATWGPATKSPYPPNKQASAYANAYGYNCYGAPANCSAYTDASGNVIVNGIRGNLWSYGMVCGSSNSGHTYGGAICVADSTGITAVSMSGWTATSFGAWH